MKIKYIIVSLLPLLVCHFPALRSDSKSNAYIINQTINNIKSQHTFPENISWKECSQLNSFGKTVSEPSQLTIVINSQAIKSAFSDEEYSHALKGVIAHEMGHIYLGHTSLLKNFLLIVGAPVAMALISSLLISKSRLYKKYSDTKSKKLLLLCALLACSHTLCEYAHPIYNRKLERQADITGMSFLGNDPSVINASCVLIAQRRDDRGHPPKLERIAYLKSLIES